MGLEKSKEEIQATSDSDVYTLEEFIGFIEAGSITRYDGNGYFHDGVRETEISVWDNGLTWNDVKDYPYVCWYNK